MTDGVLDLTLGPISPIELIVEAAPIQLIIAPQPIELIVAPEPIRLTVEPQPLVLQFTGVGTQGPPGSTSTNTTAEAGETISALKPVVIIDGIAYVADQTNPLHRGFLAGISNTAATIGNQVQIVTIGAMRDVSWNWDVTKPWIFIGTRVLTQTPPSGGWLQSVARVETSDTIFVDLSEVTERI